MLRPAGAARIAGRDRLVSSSARELGSGERPVLPFRIQLAPMNPALGESPAQPDPIRVLLVEDHLGDVELLIALLASRGAPRVDLTPVRTVAEAERALLDREFDVLLLDLDLPDASGLTGLVRLCAAAPLVPIAVLTGVDDAELARRALARGAQDYLSKHNLTREGLVRALSYAIQRQRVQAELESVSDQLREANSRLAKLALIDPLTDLLNRRGLQQVLTREIHWARRDGSELIVFLIDLDDFKRINDGLGHAVGDVVLQGIAGALRESLRTTDYVARIGGDEFLVLLPQTRLAEGLKVAEKVRRSVAGSLVALGERSVGVTASVGVVQVEHPTASIDELLRQCQLELQSSKRAGKNRVSARGGETAENASQHEELERLWRTNGFRAVRQPVVELATGRRVGYEFLTRALSEDLGQPADFFRQSYESNMLTLVDHHCFELGLCAAAELPRDQDAHLNLFPSTMIDVPAEHLLDGAGRVLEPARLCIEISESQIIGDPSYLCAPVVALRRHGVRIAIDDVGFGRSSLESLMMLEPDIIKIDRRRVHGLAQCRDQQRSLQRLLRVAASLDAGVVAEGIETEEDLATLVEMGVALGQGYLLGRPC